MTSPQTTYTASEGITQSRKAIEKYLNSPLRRLGYILLFTALLTLSPMNTSWRWKFAVCSIFLIPVVLLALRDPFPVRNDVFTTTDMRGWWKSLLSVGILPVFWINEALFDTLGGGDLYDSSTFLPHYQLSGGFFLALALVLVLSTAYSYLLVSSSWGWIPKPFAAVPIPEGVTDKALDPTTNALEDARNRILTVLHIAGAYTGTRVFMVKHLGSFTGLDSDCQNEALGLLQKDGVVEISNAFVNPMASINPSPTSVPE